MNKNLFVGTIFLMVVSVLLLSGCGRSADEKLAIKAALDHEGKGYSVERVAAAQCPGNAYMVVLKKGSEIVYVSVKDGRVISGDESLCDDLATS